MSEVPAKLDAIEARYKDAEIAKLDGVSVDYPDWHFNVRASNTEPLLRLNLEAESPEVMEKRRNEVLQIIRG
jgi:phosphomannomutase